MGLSILQGSSCRQWLRVSSRALSLSIGLLNTFLLSISDYKDVHAPYGTLQDIDVSSNMPKQDSIAENGAGPD